MDLLVVSDTHGRADRLEQLLRRIRPGVLLFLGDGVADLSRVELGSVTVRAVRGNCDPEGTELPLVRVETFGKYRIFMTHGHRYGIKYSMGALLAAAAEAEADALLYGHTHIPFSAVFPSGEHPSGVCLPKPLAVLCPGSLGAPREGEPSFGTLTLRDNGVLPAATRC